MGRLLWLQPNRISHNSLGGEEPVLPAANHIWEEFYHSIIIRKKKTGCTESWRPKKLIKPARLSPDTQKRKVCIAAALILSAPLFLIESWVYWEGNIPDQDNRNIAPLSGGSITEKRLKAPQTRPNLWFGIIEQEIRFDLNFACSCDSSGMFMRRQTSQQFLIQTTAAFHSGF